MLNLYSANIAQMYLHKVGNRSRDEGIVLSDKSYQIDDELSPLLKEFFLKPFRDKEEMYYELSSENGDVDFNQLHQIIHSNVSKLDLSQKVTAHLYEQSMHPHIKSGEVYVCFIDNIILDNKKVSAIGIFKSEVKQDFLQFKKQDNHLEAILTQGVNLSKLDKGCLILQTDEGNKVMSVDNNRYDTRYWLENFLNVTESMDENFYTKKYLKFCQDFAKDVVIPSEDKKEGVLFLNRAVNHFAKNDKFDETQFLNDVLENPDLQSEFKHYKFEKSPKYDLEDINKFEISNTAVSEARKKLKSSIKLDTNIEIKMNFINPESLERFIEKGWDEEKQMYYYLVYFNKETN